MSGKQNRRRGVKFERALAQFLQATRVPLSGAGAVKGDVLIPVYDGAFLLIEAKTTVQKTYVVRAQMLEKLIIDRIAMHAFGVRAAMLAIRLAWFTDPIFLISEEDIHLLTQAFVVPFPVQPYTAGIVDVATTVQVAAHKVTATFPVRFVGSKQYALPSSFIEEPARAVWYAVPPSALVTWLRETRDYYGYIPPSPRRTPTTTKKVTTTATGQLLEEFGYDDQAC